MNDVKPQEVTNAVLRDLALECIGSRPMEPAMALAIAANFGSVDEWRKEFSAQADVAMDTSGWAVLAFEPARGTLANRTVTDRQPLAPGLVPLLAIDIAGSDAATLASRVNDVDWDKPYKRYQSAVHAASEPFGAGKDELGDAVLLDVRRAGVFEQSKSMLPGASWRDPAKVQTWADELPTDREVIVYCVYGHEVGRSTAMRLRASGLNARYLRGGIDEWLAAGRQVMPKPQ